MDPALRLTPGQRTLTPAQLEETRRFAAERIATQLSTEPVNEPETEQLLRQAYAVVGFPPPEHILWLDGPLELLVRSGLPIPDETNIDNMDRASPWWNILPPDILATIGYRSGDPSGFWRRQLKVEDRIISSVGDHLWDRIESSVGKSVAASLWDRIAPGIQAGISEWIEAGTWASLPAHLRGRMQAALQDNVYDSIVDAFWTPADESIRAYDEAPRLACFCFLEVYLAPNELHALAHFNERVSGYWLGNKGAVLVRRPRLLSRDAGGRLHSESGKCIEYHDGWGISAWHGVRVPEQVILTPETLTREDFQSEQNLEVRRVIQERMGERFVTELGGRVIDTSPQGTLYEVRLPADDPEPVARYVQVQDSSTPRQYFLRVPSTIQTAAEAVAWSFHLSVEEYAPTQET
jgi:hypothetical protein